MIIFFATALERKWPSQINFHISSPNLALRLHWILPSIMPTCPLSKRKPSNWLLRWMLRCIPGWYHHLWLAWQHQGSPMPTMSLLATLWVTHCWRWTCVLRRSPHHPSMRKGEGPWYSAPVTPGHYQNTVACLWLCLLAWYQQGHWGCCLAMWTVHEISGPECCYTTHTNTNTYTFTAMADMCIRHLHIGWCGLPHPCWFLIQHNPGIQSPAGQSNSAKVIHILKEWFHGHGILEVLYTDNGLQYANAAFSDCSIEWGFTHETSSPHYPQSNGFAESGVKIVKHTLQHAKYWGTNPRIALQHLKASPVDDKLPSPSQMLYSHKICTIIPSRIWNTDPAVWQVQEHLED